jgi:hypothetical protein
MACLGDLGFLSKIRQLFIIITSMNYKIYVKFTLKSMRGQVAEIGMNV